MSPEAQGSDSRWSDLSLRLLTGFAMAGTALVAFAAGGPVLVAFVCATVGIVVWELARMTLTHPAAAMGAAAGLACAGLALLPQGVGLPLVMLPVLVALGRVRRERLAYAFFATAVVLAGYGMIALHRDFGLVWLVWLLLVVGLTDIFGYFAGRLIGGPKFWPAVSPKKTWSGTVAGWLAAAAVGIGFALWMSSGAGLVGLSVALSMASQMGDIAESALKRRVGVKDSSTLLPGHGGFFDRLDGVLGASLLLLLVGQLVDFPPQGG